MPLYVDELKTYAVDDFILFSTGLKDAEEYLADRDIKPPRFVNDEVWFSSSAARLMIQESRLRERNPEIAYLPQHGYFKISIEDEGSLRTRQISVVSADLTVGLEEMLPTIRNLMNDTPGHTSLSMTPVSGDINFTYKGLKTFLAYSEKDVI